MKTRKRKIKNALIISAVLLCVYGAGCTTDTDEYDGAGGAIDSPVSVAVNGDYAYVMNANFDLSGDKRGAIAVIDIPRSLINRNDCIIQRLETSSYIGQMAINAEGTIGYLANRRSSSIMLIDLGDPADPRIIDLEPDQDGDQGIKVGIEPFGVVLSPDEKTLYVTAVGSGDLSIVDLVERRLIKNEQISWGINDIALQPGGSYAYVTNKGIGSVALIDIVENRYVTDFALGSYMHGVGNDTRGVDFTPDGRWAFIAARNPESLLVIDTSKMPDYPEEAVVDLLPTDYKPTAVRVTPDGEEVWVTNYTSNNVYAYDTHTHAALEVITVGDGPYDIAMAPADTDVEGQYWVFVSNFRSHNVSLIDSASKEYIWVIP